MRVLVRDGEELIETRTFGSGPITIGSGADCSLRLAAREVNIRHAVISPGVDGGWVIESTGNGPPTLLNGRPLKEPTPIKDADEISIANFKLIVHGSAGETPEKQRSATRLAVGEVAELGTAPLPPGSVVKKPDDEVRIDGATGQWLAQITTRLRECTDIPKLIDFTLQRLMENFEARFAFVGVRRRDYGLLEYVQDRSLDGRTTGEPPMFEVYRSRCLDLSQSLFIDGPPVPDIGTAIVTPMACDRGDLGILYADRKPDVKPLSVGDLDKLRLMARLVAAQLELLIFEQLKVQQNAADGRLTFVREMQARMDPTAVPDWPGLQLAVYCKPGVENSGDVYDLMQLSNGLAAVLVTHLSGEPMRCAIAMAEVRAAFRMAGLHADAPHMYLRSVNWLLHADRVPCRMQTVALVLNPESGEMQFATAGDIGAIVVDANGGMRQLAHPNDPPLGETPNHAYESRFDQLRIGESLALYTAGCCTIMNETGEPLGRDRFVESIRDGCRQAASVVLDDLIQEHAAFFKHGRPSDDTTILVFHRPVEPV